MLTDRQADREQFKNWGHSNPLWIVGGAGQYHDFKYSPLVESIFVIYQSSLWQNTDRTLTICFLQWFHINLTHLVLTIAGKSSDKLLSLIHWFYPARARSVLAGANGGKHLWGHYTLFLIRTKFIRTLSLNFGEILRTFLTLKLTRFLIVLKLKYWGSKSPFKQKMQFFCDFKCTFFTKNVKIHGKIH